MSVEITTPQLGESIVEATVGHWLKAQGDAVTAGEPLVELETDKVNIEVSSPSDGVLASILKQEGETVGVGEVLAQVSAEQPAATPAPSPAPAATTAATATTAAASNGATAPTPAAEPVAEAAAEPAGSARATPLARRFADERHIDLQAINGTGVGGKITQEDVEAFVTDHAAPAAAPQPPTPQPTPTPAPVTPTPQPAPSAPVVGEAPREERVRMSRRRQVIAKRLVEAQHSAAMLTTFNEIDMSAVIEMRKRRRDVFKERYGVSLGYMSFFTKATLGALKAFPRLNAEIDGDEMILKRYYDIGIAVGVEEGLVVPVLRDADRLSFAEIERRIAVYADKARKNQLSLEDIRGGTFTISNGGIYGSLLSTPILNGPQVGILGMHKIEERPIAVNGQVVIHPMMYVALSYDHRIVDGTEAVRFLARIKELVEDPEALLLEG
ncbi:MAG TPA: 2-oxoglutarate dehydrogenase complex dihydrolipoyllysine-residue succinyltransferase [Ktedonobacterales bacterium]|jgi:2-oxoglutarate dehydrogenase E2 component (dihydrolipoamide succinyltransferase)|nr:2-oxoglutarate dehydrogenase complex dihydrolipoyllysine-residue succinyltransferase [Ktedonobacterales bacterium]